MNHAFSFKKTGQSLAEYTLIGGLVVLGSMGAVSLLGGSLNLSMEKLLASFSPVVATSSTPSLPAATTPVKSNNAYSTASNVMVAGIQPITVDLGGGKSITIPNFPTNSIKLYETAGASGVTESAALTLIQLANALKDNGELTDQQASDIIALANQGHRMGQAINLSQAAVSNGTYSVTLQGQTYVLDDLINSLGSNGDLNPTNPPAVTDFTINMPSSPRNTIGNETESQHFVSLYNQALASGQINNPVVKSLIDELSTRVLMVSDVFESSYTQFREGYASSNYYTDNMPALLVHSDSKAICISGNGSSSGTSCQ